MIKVFKALVLMIDIIANFIIGDLVAALLFDGSSIAFLLIGAFLSVLSFMLWEDDKFW